MTDTREFDIIVYGATGYTGRLVAEYLNNHYGSSGSLSDVIQAIVEVDAECNAHRRGGVLRFPESLKMLPNLEVLDVIDGNEDYCET